jgi:sterol desaturase/sphingolipid hydroxylase (fatty acid hydroxylase superfamily)
MDWTHRTEESFACLMSKEHDLMPFWRLILTDLSRGPLLATLTVFPVNLFVSLVSRPVLAFIGDRLPLWFASALLFVLVTWITHLIVYWCTALLFLHCDGLMYLVWPSLFGSEEQRAVLLSQSAPVSRKRSGSAIQNIVVPYAIPFKPAEEPSTALVVDSLRSTFLGQMKEEPFVLFATFVAFLRSMPVLSRDASGTLTLAPLPSAGSIFLDLVLAYALNWISFYWLHRLCHINKWLYRTVHKQHHQYKASICVSADYATLWDNLLTGLPPTILYWAMSSRGHLSVWLVWFSWRTYESLEAHSGYSFRGSLLSRLGLLHQRQARFHQFHHTKNIGNYGLEWTDRLFGTMTDYHP